MSQSLMINRTSYLLFTAWTLCLCLSTGCAFSKNLLGKSSLANPALPAQIVAGAGTANPDCAVPNSQSKPTELTAYPVAPQTTATATGTANAAPVNNGTTQQPLMQQPAAQQQYAQLQPVPQSPSQQPQYAQQQPVMQQQPIQYSQPTAPLQNSDVVQQPAQPQSVQPMIQAVVTGTSTQGQGQVTSPQSPQAVGENVPGPGEFQEPHPNQWKLPTATINPCPNHPKEVGNSEMTAAPVAAFRSSAHPGGAGATCPPGTLPADRYVTDTLSSPEKLAECEKQVFEMNQKLNELQFNTLKAALTMEQMAEQQRQLLIDNENLRLRAERADKRYLEELDSLSEIVGEVVSQAGSGTKSSATGKSSRSANPLRPVPQSATGQSL